MLAAEADQQRKERIAKMFTVGDFMEPGFTPEPIHFANWQSQLILETIPIVSGSHVHFNEYAVSYPMISARL